MSLFTLVCHPLHPFFLQIPFPHCSLSAMCTRDIFHNSHILRSVDLWVKKCVKSRAFLLRRGACLPLPSERHAPPHYPEMPSTRYNHLRRRYYFILLPYFLRYRRRVCPQSPLPHCTLSVKPHKLSFFGLISPSRNSSYYLERGCKTQWQMRGVCWVTRAKDRESCNLVHNFSLLRIVSN